MINLAFKPRVPNEAPGEELHSTYLNASIEELHIQAALLHSISTETASLKAPIVPIISAHSLTISLKTSFILKPCIFALIGQLGI